MCGRFTSCWCSPCKHYMLCTHTLLPFNQFSCFCGISSRKCIKLYSSLCMHIIICGNINAFSQRALTLIAKQSAVNFQPPQMGWKTNTWIVEERRITYFSLAGSTIRSAPEFCHIFKLINKLNLRQEIAYHVRT